MCGGGGKNRSTPHHISIVRLVWARTHHFLPFLAFAPSVRAGNNTSRPNLPFSFPVRQLGSLVLVVVIIGVRPSRILSRQWTQSRSCIYKRGIIWVDLRVVCFETFVTLLCYNSSSTYFFLIKSLKMLMVAQLVSNVKKISVASLHPSIRLSATQQFAMPYSRLSVFRFVSKCCRVSYTNIFPLLVICGFSWPQ